MAIKYYDKYPQRWESPSQDYPQGAFKNLSALGEQDGSYLEASWLNDQSGFFGALLRNAEMTPNGLVDTAQKSQFYDALLVCARKAVNLGDYYTKEQVDGKIVEEWGDRADATLSQKFISLNLNYISPDLVNKSLRDTLKLNRYVDLQDKIYNVNDPIKITDTTLNVSGGNIVRDATMYPSFLIVEKSDNALIRDLNVENISASSSTVGHNFSFIDSSLFNIKNVKIEGFAGTGSGVIAYKTDGIGEGGTILNSSFEGDSALSPNTNGFLIVDHANSLMSGLVAKGAGAFAIEYKNRQRDSIISDSIAENSMYGFGYGQTLADGEVAVNHTVSNNTISKNCAHGWVLGKAQYNVISNAIIYNDEGHNFASKIGVRLIEGSNYNSICNISISGDMVSPLRIDNSSYNYVSFAPHTLNSSTVAITGNSVRNVIDIQSPSSRSSILTSINDTTGNPISGSTSNPVFCHATGEYRGSLSGRWRWIHDESGKVISSSLHKWVFESKGSASIGILSDGTGTQGLSVSNGTYNPSFSYTWSSDYWNVSLKDLDTGYRFYPTMFRTEDDNAKSLGNTSHRWTQLYATTGTINTSDERLKDQVRDLTDTEKLIALELKSNIKAFKWKDAIDTKGEIEARIHIGVMAQTVVAIFEKYGLDAHDYALLCHDEWTDEETSEKRDQYGVRYDQLLAFIIGSL